MFVTVFRDKPLEDAIALMLAERAEVRVTFRDANSFLSLPSRVIGSADGQLCLLDPGELEQSYPWQEGQRLTLTVWLRNFKHMAASTFLRRQRVLEKDEERPAIVVSRPELLYQISARLSERVAVPSSEKVRCVFWPGSHEMKRDALPVMPAWSGNVLDISAGGMQVRAHNGAGKLMRSREIAGLEITFGADPKTISLNAHFCYGKPDDGDLNLYGFAFVPNDDLYMAAKEFLLKKLQQYPKL